MMVQRLFNHYTKNKFNPTSFAIEEMDVFHEHRTKRENLYVNKLGLPNMMWRNASVLEVGCSSGENSVLLGLLGAKMSFIEPIEDSVNRLRFLFERFGCVEKIEDVYVDFIENVTVSKSYDVVIAEGFLHTLKNRREVVRKLFEAVSPEGFLVTANPDPYGYFIEYFKTYMAHVYCWENNIFDIDDQVKAVEPFFFDDFNKIAHTRPFSSWIKDSFFNPAVIPYEAFVYGIEAILNDLSDLKPRYYSSWPSYQPTNSLRWHKDVPSLDEVNEGVMDAYKARVVSFITGYNYNESESIDNLFNSKNNGAYADMVLQTLRQMSIILEKKEPSPTLSPFLDTLIQSTSGILKNICVEMKSLTSSMTPENYADLNLLRSTWGVPFHYIVLKKENASI